MSTGDGNEELRENDGPGASEVRGEVAVAIEEPAPGEPAPDATADLAAGIAAEDIAADDNADDTVSSSRAHRLWLRINLALLLLMIGALAIQLSAMRGCAARAEQACQSASGVRRSSMAGFGPWMRCRYQCREREQLALSRSRSVAPEALCGLAPDSTSRIRASRSASEPGQGARIDVGQPLTRTYAQN